MDNSEKRIRKLYQRLLAKYGEPEQPREMSGIDYVIETILSQNTNDISRDKAFKQLKDRFGDNYEAIENADIDEVIECIRICGLGPTKAERIQKTLQIIREEREEYSIEFLKDMAVEDAKNWLTEIPGIGPKTASVILGFHFKMPTFPVDTHVQRLATECMELVPEDSSRTQTHNILEDRVPDDVKYEFHILLITHGREECTARNPGCEFCNLEQ